MADEQQVAEENVGEAAALTGNPILIRIKQEVGEPEVDADVQEPMEIDAAAPNNNTEESSPTIGINTVPTGNPMIVRIKQEVDEPEVEIDFGVQESMEINVESVKVEPLEQESTLQPSPPPTVRITHPPPPSPSNWREGKSIPQMMEYILEHDDVSRKDVIFFVGEGEELEEISAHKLFLSFVSPVFEYELYGNPDVQNVTGQLNIHLPGVNPTFFRLLLRYIYTNKLEVESKNALELLKVAKRFKLLDLADNCREILRKEICDDNVAQILTATWDFNEPLLKELALNYIHQNAKKVLSSDNFFDWPREALREILNHDDLNADEISIFQSAIRWAEHRIKKKKAGIEDLNISDENIRNELQDVIYCIRFPLMTPEEFTDNVGNRGILKEGDIIKMYKYLCSKSMKFDPKPFSKDNRSGRTEGRNKSQSSEDSEPYEPPRKTRRIDDRIVLTELETVERIETSPSPHVIDPQEEVQAASVEVDMDKRDFQLSKPISTGFTVLQTRLSSSISNSDDASIVDVSDDSDSDSDFSVILVNEDEKNSQNKSRKNSLLNDSQVAQAPSKNTLSELYNQILLKTMNPENNLEEITAICKSDPIVINPCLSICMLPYLPQLKEFSVNYLHTSKSVKGLKSYLHSLNLGSSLFFFKPAIDDDNLRTLWKSEIKVSIQVNGLNILKIDHESKSLIVSRINKSSESIMEGLMLSAGIRKIHLEEIKIDSLDLIPTDDLEVMTLRNVRGIKNRVEYLRKCDKLEEFSCSSMGDETIDLGVDIGIARPGTRLRRLALGKAKLHCSIKKLDNPLEELYLDNCTLTPELQEAFPFIFPNLKKIKVCRNVTLKFFLKIFEIKTIEWIGIWDLPIRKINTVNTPRKKYERKSAFSPEDQDVAERVKAILEDVDFREDSSWINSNTDQTIILENVNARIRENNSQESQQGTQLTSRQQFRQRIQFHAQQNNPLGHERWEGRRLKKSSKYNEFTDLDYEQFDWRMFYSDYHQFNNMNR